MTLSLDGETGVLPPSDRFLEWKAVRSLTGFSRTTAWRRQKAGDFPTPRQISPGRVGWLESEVNAWRASRAPREQSHLPAYRPPPAKASPKPDPMMLAAQPSAPDQAAPQIRPTPKLRPRSRVVDEAQGAFDF